MHNTLSDESMIVLREHGYDHVTFLDDETPAYEINIYYNGRPDQTVYINDMFGYEQIVDLLFNYHSRFVSEIIDDLSVVAVDADTGEQLYERSSDV